jgi:hypothetical protein
VCVSVRCRLSYTQRLSHCVCVFVGVGVGAFIRFWHMSNTYIHDACMQ